MGNAMISARNEPYSELHENPLRGFSFGISDPEYPYSLDFE